jgi:soluble lytic murein transglycosylase-like protein
VANATVPDDESSDAGDDDLFPDVDIDLLLPGLRASRADAGQAGAAGAPPARPGADGPSGTAVPQRRHPSPASGRAASPSARERDRRAARIREHVARRMRGVPEHESRRVSDVILEASAWARLDPVLILAIIEVESAFDLSARSNRDARGLMQVRPATLWREAELAGLAGDDPYEPALNVRAGSLYFRRLVDAFGMNDVALMAYNAGPNRILRHLRAGGIPERYFDYPRRVRAAETRLRALLATESAAKVAARDSPLRAQRQD